MNKLTTSVLIVAISLVLVACSGGTVTETMNQTQTQTTSIHEELTTSEIVKKVSPAVAYIETPYSIGTGTVISENGYILTNNHVVEEEDYAIVRFPDGKEVIAEVVYRDPDLDIAIIKCSGTGYPYVPLGSIDEPTTGDDVIAMGHPIGSGESATISKGVISSFRTIEGIQYIQTDAAANLGSSGGPLFNTYGEVIGIVVGALPDTEGMNFAVELNSIKTYINDILIQLIDG